MDRKNSLSVFIPVSFAFCNFLFTCENFFRKVYGKTHYRRLAMRDNLHIFYSVIKNNFRDDKHMQRFLDAPYFYSVFGLGRAEDINHFDYEKFSLEKGIVLIEDELSLMGLIDSKEKQIGLKEHRLYIEAKIIETRFLLLIGQISNVRVQDDLVKSDFNFGAALSFDLEPKLEMKEICREVPDKHTNKFSQNAIACYKELMSIFQLVKPRQGVVHG